MMKPSHRILLIIMLAMALPMSREAKAQGLLPKPQSYVAGKGFFSTVKPQTIAVDNRFGADATDVFTPSWLTEAAGQVAPGKATKRVVVLDRLSGATSPEAYRLRVTRDSLVVKAASREGFMRAWQTVAQLTKKQGVAACDIADAPAYRWRGLMLDVSRHFFPLSHLKKEIDVMAQYKFNRLHIHLTDAAGWRMEIKRYPRLTNFAAWRPQRLWKDWNAGGNRYCPEDSAGAYGGYYTQDELRELVSYAAERGITIMPEIEMPGHSEEVLTAYPELSCTHVPYKQSDYCAGSVATIDFLQNVLKEVMDVFPSHYIHVGGDEAGKQSWKTCPLCQKKMKELGLTDVAQLQSWLITEMGKFLNENGRQLVGWDEIIDGNLAPGTTVMVWRGTEKAHEAISHGYDVVLSPGGYLYLDSYQDDPHTQPEALGGYLPLEKVYSYVPGADLPDSERTHVAGIQGNLWAEYIPTVEHAEAMLWPRALAVAEIAWNGTPKKDYKEFRARALQQIDVLRGEGLHPFDLAHETGERRLAKTGVQHKALGAKVTYNEPWNDKYTASGATTLTDGKMGGWAFGDGHWQGFQGDTCFDVTIDLGREQTVHSVEGDFFQSCGAWIYFPDRLSVALSSDGQHFDEVMSQSYEVKETAVSETRLMGWKGSKPARYIRLRAHSSHPDRWIFCDEVMVK